MELKARCGQEGLSDELGGDVGKKSNSTQQDGALTPGLSAHGAASPSCDLQGEYYAGAQETQEIQRKVISFIGQLFNTQVS